MADILWSDIVGDKTITAGGFMGDLLTIARVHVDKAVDDNRLTQTQAGEIYTAMIPAAMQEAVRFVLDEKLKEAQITDTAANTAIREAELVAKRNLTEAELEKQWGYNVTRDPNTDELVLGDTTGVGKIDVDTDNSTKQGVLLEDDHSLKVQARLTEVENTALVREKAESEAKNNVVDGVIDTQLKKVKEEIALVYTDRVIKDKEAAALGMDDVILASKDAKTGTTVYTPYYVEAP